MLEKEDRSAYSSLAIARILEKRPDGSVVLDPNFIPCHYNVSAVPILHRFLGEMAGLMRERARNIAQRLGSPSQGGVADVADFMLLQSLNACSLCCSTSPCRGPCIRKPVSGSGQCLW